MSYNIIAVPTFRKELKKLAKKYHTLKTDLAHLFEILEENPIQGTPLGKNFIPIDVTGFAQGVYICKMTTEKGIATKKVILSR